MNSSIGIVIPTYQAARQLPFSLSPLLKSPLKPKILIIDSSSTDGTPEIAKTMGAEVLVIPKEEFNHGATREMGRLQLIDCSIVVMMTQDAIPCSIEMLERLVAPLLNGQASIAYGRQLPHDSAGFFGSFARQYNYPCSSHLRALADCDNYGIYTFFCSNSCAAYLNSALNEIGGFPTISFGEDTFTVAKLLHLNHRIAYVAEAEVCHSHDYTLKQEFVRHIEIGKSRKQYEHLIQLAGTDADRGQAYAKQLLLTVAKQKPHLLAYAFFHLAAKYTGYQIGKRL
jgi:rhamnosyltransferase